MTRILQQCLLPLVGGLIIILGLVPDFVIGSGARPTRAEETRAVRMNSDAVSPLSLQPAVWTPNEEAPVVQSVAYRRYYTRSHRRTRHYYARPYARPHYYKRRSWKKSAAIIGGSAAAGTAIGALAGGGKGAAIGAISGGAAGLIYDRATHKKRRR